MMRALRRGRGSPHRARRLPAGALLFGYSAEGGAVDRGRVDGGSMIYNKQPII